MNKRRFPLLSSFVILIIIYSQLNGVVFSFQRDLPDPRLIDGKSLVSLPPVEDAISFFQEKIRKEPDDPVSYTLLGELYLRQARESGNIAAYQRAEESLQTALDLLPGYLPAGSSLASVYYATHNFKRALDLAQRVYESNSKNTQAYILVADSYLSLGDIDKAEQIYNEIGGENPSPPILARLANLAELRGESEQALMLIRRAAGETLRSGGTRENAAWYLLRVGDIYFNQGKFKTAGRFYEASLRVFDGYYLALAGLGKVSAAEGNYEDAIKYYQHASNIVPQPDFIAALGDLYTMTGQPDQAALQYEVVDYIGDIASANKQVYNRQLANFYADHHINLDKALQLALAELDVRGDIYGYDTAAWAYYNYGEFEQAQSMMDQAMAHGTQDARLFYHAGMIAYAMQEYDLARQYLHQALEINPHFAILQPADALQTLNTLESTARK